MRRLLDFWLKYWNSPKPEVSKEPAPDSLHVREVDELSDKEIEKNVSRLWGKNLAMAWKAGARWARRRLGGKP